MAIGVKIDHSELRQSIDLRRSWLHETAIANRLREVAELYVELLRADIRSKVSSLASGNLEDALCTIVPVWRTAKGLAIGIGDIERVGLPSDAPASRQTIREFRNWFNEALERGDAEALAAQARRLQARAKARAAGRREPAPRRVEAAPPSKVPTLSEYERSIVAAAQARRAEERRMAQERLERIAQRHREFLKLGTVGGERAFTFESGRRLADRLRQRVSDLRALRDAQLASPTLDARTRRILRNQFERQIGDARFDLTALISSLRRMRDLAD